VYRVAPEMDREEHPPTAQSDQRSRSLAFELSWIIAVSLLIGAGTVVLVKLGSLGTQIATVLSVTTAVIAIVLPVASTRLTRVVHSRRLNRLMKPTRWRLRILTLSSTALIAVAIGMAIWAAGNLSEINITDEMQPTTEQTLRDTMETTIQIPGHPPRRNELTLMPVLTNSSSTGDCVVPARIDVNLFADKEFRTHISANSGQRVTLSLVNIRQNAQIGLTLHEPDSACGVTLRLAEAILHN
jgi:hypothetical protein